MKGLQRHDQFMMARALAASIGFGFARQIDLRTRCILKTNGAQEAPADTEWKISFLSDALTDPLAERTTEPKLQDGQALSNEYLLVLPALTVEHDQHITTETDVELEEIASKVSECILQMKTGTNNFFEKRAGYYFNGRAGHVAAQGSVAAGPIAATVRSVLVPMKEGGDLDDPIIIFPGGSMNVQLFGQGQWVTTDDVPLTLTYHGWAFLEGFPAKNGKVVTMNEIMGDIQAAAQGDAGAQQRLLDRAAKKS